MPPKRPRDEDEDPFNEFKLAMNVYCRRGLPYRIGNACVDRPDWRSTSDPVVVALRKNKVQFFISFVYMGGIRYQDDVDRAVCGFNKHSHRDWSVASLPQKTSEKLDDQRFVRFLATAKTLPDWRSFAEFMEQSAITAADWAGPTLEEYFRSKQYRPTTTNIVEALGEGRRNNFTRFQAFVVVKDSERGSSPLSLDRALALFFDRCALKYEHKDPFDEVSFLNVASRRDGWSEFMSSNFDADELRVNFGTSASDWLKEFKSSREYQPYSAEPLFLEFLLCLVDNQKPLGEALEQFLRERELRY